MNQRVDHAMRWMRNGSVPRLGAWGVVSLLSINVAADHATAQMAASQPADIVAAPRDVTQLWQGYDPRALPLDVRVEEERVAAGTRIERLYFTSEVKDGEPARLYAITGVPQSEEPVPGILHIHGGGQTASMAWVHYWTHRGFAIVSYDWCGEVAGRTDHARWGRIRANMMKDGQARTTHPSVRASPWHHWAIAARRALTLLEQLPGVDVDRLGIFGVSMGGHLTWIVAGSDPRVKAAVPIYGCGWNTYPDAHSGGGFDHPVPPEIDLWRATMEPETYARYIACPVLLLSATNDFHTHMDRCCDSLARVDAPTWQSFTPRYNHHLEPEQGRTLERWMRWQLQGGRDWPASPKVALAVADDQLRATMQPDRPDEVTRVEIFSHEGTKRPQTRFWRSLDVTGDSGTWIASVPVFTGGPVRVFANVTYEAGQTLSSSQAVIERPALMAVTPHRAASLIDDFSRGIGDWTYGPAYTDPHIDWTYLRADEGPDGAAALTLNPQAWGGGSIQYVVGTHQVGDVSCIAPPDARLAFSVRAPAPAKLTVHVLVDHWGPSAKVYRAPVRLEATGDWQSVTIAPASCSTKDGEALASFSDIDRIDFVGESPPGQPPAFAQVRWIGAGP